MKSIKEGDDIIFKFKEDSIIEVYENEDLDPIEEHFSKDENIEVTIFSINDVNYGVQFGDGTVAFIRKDMIDFLKRI